MKRASDVPPVVESVGVKPVSARIASETRSTKASGRVRKAGAFEG